MMPRGRHADGCLQEMGVSASVADVPTPLVGLWCPHLTAPSSVEVARVWAAAAASADPPAPLAYLPCATWMSSIPECATSGSTLLERLSRGPQGMSRRVKQQHLVIA